jgi:hypothetical protein
MKRIKLELTIEVQDDFLEQNEVDDILNYCCNILESDFEHKDPTGDKKKLIWEESKVLNDYEE